MALDVAVVVEPGWPQEAIPDEDSLYMRVHRQWAFENGDLKPGVFRNQPPENQGGTGMSTDWDRYSTPRDTRFRAKTPEDNLVIRLGVGAVRRVPRQAVIHSPDVQTKNRSHTDVVGPKQRDPEVRIKLLEAAVVVIRLEEPV
jgi:hypothetical protein